MEGVRVDGLLLVGLEGHLVGGADGGVSGLPLEVLDQGLGVGSVGSSIRVGVSGAGCRRCRGFGVGGGGFRVGWLSFGDGSHSFVFLREFALDKSHGMTGGQEDDCSQTQTPGSYQSAGKCTANSCLSQWLVY